MLDFTRQQHNLFAKTFTVEFSLSRDPNRWGKSKPPSIGLEWANLPIVGVAGHTG